MTTAAGRRTRAVPWSTTRVESAAAMPVPWWALTSSAVLPTLLVTAWVVAGARQAPTYSPIRQTVSVLSGDAATDRWIVTAGLYVVGIAYLVTALGLRALAAAPRAALVVAGLAAIGVASFPEPVRGTSPVHVLCTGIGAITIAVWPALAAQQESVLAAVGVRTTVVAIAVSVALFIWMAIEARHGPMLGLAERVGSGLQSCWPFVVAMALWWRCRPNSADG